MKSFVRLNYLSHRFLIPGADSKAQGHEPYDLKQNAKKYKNSSPALLPSVLRYTLQIGRTNSDTFTPSKHMKLLTVNKIDECLVFLQVASKHSSQQSDITAIIIISVLSHAAPTSSSRL